jgi:hypothetical protein
MFNPPNFYNSGSYFDLLKRLIQRVQQEKVDKQILEIVQQVCEKELDKNNIVLSRPERVRLFHQLTKTVLTGMLAKLEESEK